MKTSRRSEYTLIWIDDSDNKRTYNVMGVTWIGRPGGFNITWINPYMVILVPENDRAVESQIHDSTVSRRHAVLKPLDEGIEVLDYGRDGKGSSNGTYINEKRIMRGSRSLAKPGDSIRIGLYTVFKVGVHEKDKAVELVKPGDLVLVEDIGIRSLPRELLKTSVRMENGKYLVFIPPGEKLSKNSFDSTLNTRVRIDNSYTSEKDIERRIIQNILLYLKDVMLDLNKDPPKGIEAASKVGALLKVREYREIIEEVVGDESAKNIALLADLIMKGRGEQPQVKRLILEVSTLEKALDLRLRTL